MRRVAALCRFAVFIDSGISRDIAFQAVLLFPAQTIFAFSAGINHAADTNAITDFVFRYTRTDRCDQSRDFMPRHEWIVHMSPLTMGCMDIRMADTRKLDFDQNVLFIQFPSLDFSKSERFVRTVDCSCSR